MKKAPQKFPKEKVFLHHQVAPKLFTRTKRQTCIHSQAQVLNNDIVIVKAFGRDQQTTGRLTNKIDNKSTQENLPCAIVLKDIPQKLLLLA